MSDARPRLEDGRQTARPVRWPPPVACRIAASLVLALVAGCKEDNRLVTPPPPRIGVALPLQQQVTPHLEATGTAVAVNSVDLAARVQGFLSAITYKDGDLVKRGDVLFQIEPTEYQAKLQQAQAAPANSQAQLVQAEAELNRQSTLGREAWSAQSTIEQAQALRDGLRATITGQQAGVTLAQLDLGYTRVAAPFDGTVSAHLLSVSNLVGVGGPTRLATIVQLDPIHVSFTISEQDALRLRAQMAARGVTVRDIGSVPVEAGMMTEEAYPHRGRLDYRGRGARRGPHAPAADRDDFARADPRRPAAAAGDRRRGECARLAWP